MAEEDLEAKNIPVIAPEHPPNNSTDTSLDGLMRQAVQLLQYIRSNTNNISGGGSGGGAFTVSQLQRTDASGKIQTANTAQDVFPSGSATHGYLFQNLSDIEMYVRDDGSPANAGQGSYKILPMGTLECPTFSPPLAQLSVICSEVNAVYTCKYW